MVPLVNRRSLPRSSNQGGQVKGHTISSRKQDEDTTNEAAFRPHVFCRVTVARLVIDIPQRLC